MPRFGQWGRLAWTRDGALAVVSPAGARRELDTVEKPPTVVGAAGWVDDADGLIVVGDLAVDCVTVVDLGTDEVVASVLFDRDPDVGLRFLRFFAAGADRLCCLTETTLFALDGNGRLVWLRVHQDVSVTLAAVSDDRIELESLQPDLDPHTGQRFAYDARTGAEPCVRRADG